MQQIETNGVSHRVNQTQKRVRLIGICLFLLTLIFPPWRYHFHVLSSQCYAGYHFILKPPPSKSPEEYKEMFAMEEGTAQMFDHLGAGAIIISIDFYNLIIEWLFLLFFIAGLMPIFSDDKFFGHWLTASGSLTISAFFLWLLFAFSSCHAA